MTQAALQNRVLVAGGGIAGLSAAIALAQQGFDITVFEKTQVPSEAGAGLQLGPNAVHALRSLGAADDVARFAVEPKALAIKRGRDGRVLTRLPLGPTIEARHGAPYWVVHRADLRTGLLLCAEREPRIEIVYGTDVAGAENAGNGVRVGLGDGRQVEGRALIGADGVWSAARAAVVPNLEPQQSGYVAFRAVVPAGLGARLGALDEVGTWLRPDAHLVHYPVRGGGAVNVVVIAGAQAPRDTWSEPASKQEVLPLLGRFSQGLADAFDDVAWLKWALAAPVHLATWSNGAIVLTGDAAHGMLPFLAQGASMSLEDAVVLGRVVGQANSDIPAAFRAFTAARMARVRRVQDGASQNGRIFHLDGMMATARDATLTLWPAQALLARLDWLYGARA